MCKENKKGDVKSNFLYTGTSKNSVAQVMFLRTLNVTPRHRTTVSYKEVSWVCSPPGWYKCNIDGAAQSSPGEAICAKTFTDFREFHRCSFTLPFGVRYVFFAEVMAFMNVVEISSSKGRFPMKLETDSQLLVVKVQKLSKVSWIIINNCLQLLQGKQYIIFHIHREGNTVGNAIANERCCIDNFTWWYDLPHRALEGFLVLS